MAHPSHPGLRARVQYLEQEYGANIHWRHGPPTYPADRRFLPVIEVVHPVSWKNDPRGVPLGDRTSQLREPHSPWPTGERISVSRDDLQADLAVLDGRVVYLLVDIEGLYEYAGDVDVVALFDIIFERAIPKAADYVRAYDWSRERTAFVDWRAESLDRQIRTWRSNVRDNDYELDNLTRRIANLVRVNSELRDNINTAERTTRSARGETASADFIAITKMIPEVVETVRLDYGRLKIRLAPVAIKHEGHSYDMGRYTITFDGDSIRVLGDNGHDYPHPHVSSDGIPCWGNLGPSVGKLLGEGEFAALVTAIRQFLSSYNERDAYRELHLWDPDQEPGEDDEGYEPEPRR